MKEVFIYDAIRTPRGHGKTSGSLYEVKPIELLVTVLNALRDRNQLDTGQVDDLLVGCVSPIRGQGGNIAKAALLYAGWDNSVAGMQLNRLCASGLEAVNLAAAKIRSGWDELIVAGGVESMSRTPIGSDGGALLFDPEVINKVSYIPQGVAADLIATIQAYSRETIDAYALQSQQRAIFAQESGYFDQSIIPIHDANGLVILDKDEYIRPGTTMERLGLLQPAFETIGNMGANNQAIRKYPFVEKITHVHTPGNSSGIVDGSALVLIGNEEKGKALDLKPRAKILSVATTCNEPVVMLEGSAAAARKALALANLDAKDIDLWEMNEAFSAPVLNFQQEMEIDSRILNVNGGAIALGHPLGATGAMLLGTLLDELERRDLSTGLVALCVGGGMGIATVIKKIA